MHEIFGLAQLTHSFSVVDMPPVTCQFLPWSTVGTQFCHICLKDIIATIRLLIGLLLCNIALPHVFVAFILLLEQQYSQFHCAFAGNYYYEVQL